MIQPRVSPDLITQNATGSSFVAFTPRRPASAWGLLSVKRGVPTPNTNTLQSELEFQWTTLDGPPPLLTSPRA